MAVDCAADLIVERDRRVEPEIVVVETDDRHPSPHLDAVKMVGGVAGPDVVVESVHGDR